MNLTEYNIRTDEKIKEKENINQVISFDIVPVTMTTLAASNVPLNTSHRHNTSYSKSFAMPLQHYAYEDLSSSNQFLEKVLIT